MQAFVPKNRRPKFELTLKITDLNNVPLVAGTCCVKWHLPSSTSAEHRGRTDKALIKDHKAVWDYEKTMLLRLTIDRNASLHDTEIHFEITQEYSTHGRGIQLGFIKLNLSEYVNKDDDEDSFGITRRYLMQQSKINSTLKIGLRMKQLEGEKNLIAPPLKGAMVFGGIAGLMASEPGEVDQNSAMPTSTTKARELGERQDMYRRTLAASWSCVRGELPPDKLVEDLFAGGDGGIMAPPAKPGHRLVDDDSDRDSRRSAQDSQSDSARTPTRHQNGHSRGGSKSGSIDTISTSSIGGMAERSPIETRMNLSSRGKKQSIDVRELSEFDVREDLRSWSIETRG